MSRFILPFQSVYDLNGHPLDGALLYFYETGTSTLKDTFSDATLTTPNSNPVVANNQGEFDDIFLDGEYRVELQDKNGVTQPNYPADNVPTSAASTYATVAAMKLITLGAGAWVTTKGYYTAGDNGGATYLIKTLAAFGSTPDNYGDHSLTNTNVAVLQNGELVNVKQFGAKGNAVDDDLLPIQAAINTLGLDGGTMRFPRAVYCISDSLKFGQWSIDAGDGDVLGFARAKSGIRVVGETRHGVPATIKWIGALQLGDNAVTQSDSVGNYTYITNDKAMIWVVAGKGHYFEGLSLDGDNKAHTGFEFEGNGANIAFTEASIRNCRVGIRFGKQIRHDTLVQYWGYADSPYYKANVYDAPAVGGFQCDTTSVRNVFISHCAIGISVESAQMLSCNFDTVWIANTAASMANWAPIAGVVNIGGRINMRGVGVGGDMTYGIYNVANTSAIEVQEFHDESTSTYSYQGNSGAGAKGRISFHNGDLKGVNFPAGDGTVTLTNVLMSGQITRGADASATHPFMASLRDVRASTAGALISLGTVTNKSNVLLSVDNVVFTGGGFVTVDYGAFIGRVGQTSPIGTYAEWLGRTGRDKQSIEKTRQGVERDSYTTRISGIKTGIEDEATTLIGTFAPPASDFYKVTLDTLIQNTGPSSNMGGVAKTITFLIGQNSASTYFASAVVEVSSQVAGNLGSFVATYTLAIVGGGIELYVNQNNETFDVTTTLTFSGEIVGGRLGGSNGDILTLD